MKILEGETDRITQLDRTRRGMCARCGEGNTAHEPEGNCPDGNGTWTWFQTREETKETIATLEAFLAGARAAARPPKLNEEQQQLIDTIAETTLRGERVSGDSLIMKLRWPDERVKRVAGELRAMGLVR